MNDLGQLAAFYERAAFTDCWATDVAGVPECREEGCIRPPYKDGRCRACSDRWDYRIGRIGRPLRVISEDVREAVRVS